METRVEVHALRQGCCFLLRLMGTLYRRLVGTGLVDEKGERGMEGVDGMDGIGQGVEECIVLYSYGVERGDGWWVVGG